MQTVFAPATSGALPNVCYPTRSLLPFPMAPKAGPVSQAVAAALAAIQGQEMLDTARTFKADNPPVCVFTDIPCLDPESLGYKTTVAHTYLVE
eukprot:3752855-Amphidinium_carterae.1